MWHSRLDTDIHRRYPAVHAWGVAGARCAEGPYEVRCRRRQNGRGVPYLVHTCANNSWMNCHVVRRDDAANCSSDVVDLWSWSAERNSSTSRLGAEPVNARPLPSTEEEETSRVSSRVE